MTPRDSLFELLGMLEKLSVHTAGEFRSWSAHSFIDRMAKVKVNNLTNDCFNLSTFLFKLGLTPIKNFKIRMFVEERIHGDELRRRSEWK